MGTQGLIDMMGQGSIFRICQIGNIEILLRFLLSDGRQYGSLCLFVYHIVRIQLGKNLAVLFSQRLCLGRICLAFFFLPAQTLAFLFQIQLVIRLLDAVALQTADKVFRTLVQVGGLVTSSGNNQRSTGFINQDGVHLVHNSKGMSPLHHVLLIDCHVVTQIIKAEFIVGTVGDICFIHHLALIRRHIMDNQSHGHAQEAVHLAHPFTVSFCQIVIDGDDMYAFARNGIQIRRQCCYQCLAFTGFHFRNTSLMQDDTADNLYPVMPHAQNTPCCLTHGGKCLRQQVIQ